MFMPTPALSLPMADVHSRSVGASARRGFAAAAVFAFAMTGCASAPTAMKMEPTSVSSRLGFPDCSVSVPLSQSEAIQAAKKMGNPQSESYPEWIKMTASIQPGDQLRLVDCLRASRTANVGDPYYYALFRDGKVISKFHFIIIN
jgi:hypothetical protein